SRCPWIVDRVLKNGTAKWINGRLAAKRQLPNLAGWTSRRWRPRNCPAEVAISVSQRWNCCQSVCDVAGLAVLFQVEEEETFVVAVVPFTKHDRPANIETPVI